MKLALTLSLLILPFVHDFTGLVFFAIIYGLDWFATVPPSMATGPHSP